MTRTSLLRLIKITIVGLIILLVVGYSIWRSLDYTRGPRITLSEPLNWAVIHASTTAIKGRIERSNSITLNGKPIFIDEAGNFSETIALFPGTNIITLVARDQFERSVETRLTLTRNNQ